MPYAIVESVIEFCIKEYKYPVDTPRRSLTNQNAAFISDDIKLPTIRFIFIFKYTAAYLQ